MASASVVTALRAPGPPLLGDGGLANTLERRGHDLSGALWTARLLHEDPGALLAVHRDFLRAGAAVVTSASYQASFEGFAARGLDRRRAEGLLHRSVRLAATARDELAADGRPRWVAASVGPYGAMLADGSEYRGRYRLDAARLAEWHRPRLEALAGAGPDLLAMETVPDLVEAQALVHAAAGLGVPAWLSYSIEGDRTRAGQPLAEAFAVLAAAPEIAAVGVNCCDPRDVAAAVALAREVTGKPVVAYPNSGERWDPARRAWTGTPTFHAALAAEWVAAGAALVGGCCRVRPADIADLAAALDPAPGAARCR